MIQVIAALQGLSTPTFYGGCHLLHTSKSGPKRRRQVCAREYARSIPPRCGRCDGRIAITVGRPVLLWHKHVNGIRPQWLCNDRTATAGVGASSATPNLKNLKRTYDAGQKMLEDTSSNMSGKLCARLPYHSAVSCFGDVTIWMKLAVRAS